MSNVVCEVRDLQELVDKSQSSDTLIAILQRISWGEIFLPELVEQIFAAILASNPTFPVLEKTCRTVGPWLIEYGPDRDWGWFDKKEFSIEHITRGYELWRVLSEKLVEEAKDFYSALEVARHAHTRVRYFALEKALGFASMPEHLLNFTEFKAEISHGFSENDHEKFVEIVTTYRLGIPTHREMTLEPSAVKSLQHLLEERLLTIYRSL